MNVINCGEQTAGRLPLQLIWELEKSKQMVKNNQFIWVSTRTRYHDNSSYIYAVENIKGISKLCEHSQIYLSLKALTLVSQFTWSPAQIPLLFSAPSVNCLLENPSCMYRVELIIPCLPPTCFSSCVSTTHSAAQTQHLGITLLPSSPSHLIYCAQYSPWSFQNGTVTLSLTGFQTLSGSLNSIHAILAPPASSLQSISFFSSHLKFMQHMEVFQGVGWGPIGFPVRVSEIKMFS